VFSHRAGATFMGHTGDVACDHYHRYAEDVSLMRGIGLQAYRFSISWARVLPEGTGRINKAGMDFYDRLVDSLLAAGIRPWLTLFHWDYPQALFRRGGWLNRESADWFAEYSGIIVDRLSDRVSHWITLNEPQIFLGPDHGDAPGAPGLRPTTHERLITAHHALMAHGRAVQVIRARAKCRPTIGWAPIGRTKYPASDSPNDIQAARRLTLSVAKPDFWNNTWFADPVVLGSYPEDGIRTYGAPMDFVQPGDMETICQPLDFYGVNIYDGEPVRPGATGNPRSSRCRRALPRPPSAGSSRPRHSTGARASCTSATGSHRGHRERDVGDRLGEPRRRCPRRPRIDYTRRYLLALRRAIADGVDVRGYFHWSIMDNFEWQQGYKERFGSSTWTSRP
jgi:beta-glucosidase